MLPNKSLFVGDYYTDQFSYRMTKNLDFHREPRVIYFSTYIKKNKKIDILVNRPVHDCDPKYNN